MSTSTAPLEHSAPVERLDDSALLQRVGELDVDAFDELYDRHSGAAYALAVRMMGRGGRADDVLQDAFIAVWRSAGRYDAGRGSPRTWLLAVVHHRAVDALRKLRTIERRLTEDEHALALVPAGGPTVGDEVARREEARTVVAALRTLPPEQRSALELAYYGGWTQAEIAQRLDVPLGTVKSRMRLGLDKLRDALD